MSVINTSRAGRRVFREEIRDTVIDDILGGRLPPGTRIVETRLAQQFGVSQGPVREALRDLASFGFVVTSPFRGTEVRRISNEDLLEIYPIRAALEGVAAGAAATRVDEPTLAFLEELIDSMRKAVARGDQQEVSKVDIAFHHTIVKASGNRMLEHVWQSLRLAITVFIINSKVHLSLHDLVERHVPILAALRARDPIRAEAEARKHIAEPAEWILNAVESKDTARLKHGSNGPGQAKRIPRSVTHRRFHELQ
jgi:DNA-binding GntR family transcriptional regulator